MNAVAAPDSLVGLEFRLPWSPSVNNAYANSKNGGRFKVKRVKVFEELAWFAMQEQNVPKLGITYPISVTMIQHANGNRGDIDNKIKVVLDVLKKFGVLHDDNRSIVKELHIYDGRRCVGDEKPHSVIRIMPLPSEAA